MRRVPGEVLYAFNLDGEITPLNGGQGTSYRINNAVVKPVDATHSHEWLLKAFSKIKPNGYRLSQFVESRFGHYIFDGWCCTRFEPGYEVRGGLETKLAVSNMFHRDLSEITFEGFSEGEDVYAIAHRIAWQRSQIPNNVHDKTLAILGQLLGKVRLHDNYKMQIVHSDLSGNILFDDVLAPLIIDFSPKIAPVEYAEAILVIDCIAWQGSPISHLKEFINTEFRKEMLIRALIFRLSVSAIFSDEDFDEFYHHSQSFEHIVEYMS